MPRCGKLPGRPAAPPVRSGTTFAIGTISSTRQSTQLAADFFGEAEREWQAVPPGVARLRALVRRLAPSEPHQRGRAVVLFRLWSRASDHEPTALVLRAYHRRLFNLVVSFIEEAKQCAEIAHDADPSILAGILIALGDGLCVSRVLMLGDGTTEPNAAVDTVLERFATRVNRSQE